MRRVLIALVVLLAAGCSTPPAGVLERSELTAQQRAEASAVYRELLAAEDAGDVDTVRRLGEQYLVAYPGADDEDHVLWLTARAAMQRDELRLAERLLQDLRRGHPDSAFRGDAAHALAFIHRDRGRWLDEADALVAFYQDSAEDDPRRGPTRRRLRELVETRLELADLDALLERHPQSVVASLAHWTAARRVYESGTDPEDAAARLEAFVRDFPQSRYVEQARGLLAELERTHGTRLPSDLAVGRRDRIGLLCPLSGDYATLGQAMFDGALLALEEYNRATGENLQLVGLDTRGDEVVAVQQARRLIDEEKVIAIVGALLSPSTVAVATLCEERQVPLVSPTATKETIGDLGPFVFQTNLTKAFETQLLARAAVQGLLRTRLAILHPDDDDGVAVADRFAAEVERFGGRVVARAAYNREVTDFGRIMRRLREAAPEAVFVPATPTEMRLIAPQLVFNDLRAQLLGPSSWNNSLLIREAGESLEKALIPSDVALIPEEQRARFEELWKRRYPRSPSSAFGLKSYFAVRRVIDAVGGDELVTRRVVRERLELGLTAGGSSESALAMQRLRVVRGGQIEGVPLELLPGLLTRAATEAPASLELLEDETVESTSGVPDEGR